ncbi:MAG: gliding motility-associated ABC transporter permease subunit GldF [Chitinophagaceae bacterium]
MWSVFKKEVRQFFSSLTGYMAVVLFLLLNGLFLFVFPNNNVFDQGYASLETFFKTAAWVLLLLIPAITMRSFSDEFKIGTFEILKTRPISKWQLILGKYLASIFIVFITIFPTIIYVYTINSLSTDGIDFGGISGSYIGLFFLASVFVSIGICCSSFTPNAVVAFLVSAFLCFLVNNAFTAISKIPGLPPGYDYYIEMIGIDFHYESMSRGVIDTRDVIYFLSIITLFLFITRRNLEKR